MNLIEMLKDLAANDLDIVQGEDFVAISFKNRKEESDDDNLRLKNAKKVLKDRKNGSRK